MPGQDFGVYTGEAEAGTEVSSTYEGRHITVVETELIHPTHADNLVDAGDPVIICNAGVVASRGNGVGVALTSAVAVTDLIAIDTEGIWNLVYFSYDDTGAGSAIIAGDELYIHDGSTGGVGALGTGDATISKRRNNVTQIPFGYALGTAPQGGTGQIPMKVHFDPICHWVGDDEFLQFGDGNGGGPGVGGGDVTLGYDEALSLLLMLPEDNDEPTFQIGNGTLSMDVQIFGHTADDWMLWDSSASVLEVVNYTSQGQDVLNVEVQETGTHTGDSSAIHAMITKMSGAITGAGGLSAGRFDIQPRADASHVNAIKVYTGVTGVDAPTVGDMSAFFCYCDNLGGDAAGFSGYQCCDFGMDNTAQASGSAQGNSFFRLYSHGAVNNNIFVIPGGFGSTYMWNWTALIPPVEAYNAAGNAVHSIAYRVGATTSYIHTYDAP